MSSDRRFDTGDDFPLDDEREKPTRRERSAKYQKKISPYDFDDEKRAGAARPRPPLDDDEEDVWDEEDDELEIDLDAIDWDEDEDVEH